MRINLINDRWVATCTLADRDALKEAGWLFDTLRTRKWWTSDWRKAAPFLAFCEGDAYDRLKEIVDKHEAELNASYAMFAEADIAVPYIVNHKGDVLDYLPYQKAGILYAAERDDTLIADSPGLGKGAPLWAKVLTPAGWRQMGDLCVGDPVIGADGNTHHVTGVYDKGVLPVYRVEFNDGAVTHVDGDHLWQVRRKRIKTRSGEWYEPDWEVLETRELLARAYPGGIKDNKIEIPLMKPAMLDAVTLSMPPYLLGVLLGDGSIKTGTYLSNGDEGVRAKASALLPSGYSLNYDGAGGVDYRVGRKGYTGSSPSLVKDKLKELGVFGCGSDDKFVPSQYLFASEDQRRELLYGLMDTDGYIKGENTVQFSSNSRNLRDAVVFLIQSFGGTARKSQKISASGKNHYITTINATFNPFSACAHKRDAWKQREKYRPKRLFKSIDLIGSEPVRCISVSSPDKLYITDDCIVTHNTIQAIGLINHLGITSGVIVCPATLKLNWLKEMTKWLADKSLTIGVAYGGEIPNTDFVIINYDILARNRDILWAEHWGILVCDEAQYLSNAGSKRTQVIFGDYGKYNQETKRKPVRLKVKMWRNGKWELVNGKVSCLRANTRLMLTGTPMMKRPSDLWPMIRDFDPNGLGRNWEDFGTIYCDGYQGPFGFVADGGSNLDELNERLRKTFMIRRVKANVLKDLPKKTREVVLLPAEGLRKMIKTERDKFTDALAMLDAANTGIEYKPKLALEEVDPGLMLDTMSMILRDGFDAEEMGDLDGGEIQPGFAAYSEARHDLALSKLPMAIEHIKRLVEADQKVIVFAIHKDVVAGLYEAFPTAARIVGGMGAKKVEAEKLRFQGDKDKGILPDADCRVIIANLKAGGVGHTLTEANVVVFVELWTVPGDMEQCEDRAHRYGLEHNVLVQYLVVDGTMDAMTITTLITRIEIIEAAVDGTAPQMKMG